jgi:hypothetical protein
MVVMFVLGLCGLAIAQEAAGAAAGEAVSPEKIAGALSGILATGGWGGLWKGALAGIGRALLGFFSKREGTKFQGKYLVSAALSGAVAGVIVGLLGVPFDEATGWLATVGMTEVLNKAVKGLWLRWASNHVGEAVARTVARSLPSPSEGPSTS